MAPHTGHVSNFRQPVGPVIEPVGGDCFQSDTREPLAGVHGGHPVWTRLELAEGAGQLPDGRDTTGTAERWATRQE